MARACVKQNAGRESLGAVQGPTSHGVVVHRAAALQSVVLVVAGIAMLVFLHPTILNVAAGSVDVVVLTLTPAWIAGHFYLHPVDI